VETPQCEPQYLQFLRPRGPKFLAMLNLPVLQAVRLVVSPFLLSLHLQSLMFRLQLKLFVQLEQELRR
jgi:hypothetical protein